MLVSHETLCKIRENREITYSSYVQVTVTNAIASLSERRMVLVVDVVI